MSWVYDRSTQNKKLNKMIKVIITAAFDADFTTEETGASNKKQDFLVWSGPGEPLKVELKVRREDYDDILVEVTQYKQETDELMKMRFGQKKMEEIFFWLEQNSTGWMWETQADYVIYLKPSGLYIIDWKEMKKYVKIKFNNLQEIVSNRSPDPRCSSVNKILKGDFYFIKHDKRFNKILDIFYSEYLKTHSYKPGTKERISA